MKTNVVLFIALSVSAGAQSPGTFTTTGSMITARFFHSATWMIPPQVSVGGRLAQVLYFGAAPGYPGYYQVNFRVPGGVAPGPSAPVRLTYLSRASDAVTIGVQ